MLLSLSPRTDLFRFELPKSIMPDDIYNKWSEIINRDAEFFVTPIDYINESIVNIKIPGIQDYSVTQQQIATNKITPSNEKRENGALGRINVEPGYDYNHLSPANPLARIERKSQITFRLNQGLYNYFILYETLFYRIGKPWLYEDEGDWKIYILDEDGQAVSFVRLSQCFLTSISDLDFAYTNYERNPVTFTVDFAYNNINFDIINKENLTVI